MLLACQRSKSILRKVTCQTIEAWHRNLALTMTSKLLLQLMDFRVLNPTQIFPQLTQLFPKVELPTLFTSLRIRHQHKWWILSVARALLKTSGLRLKRPKWSTAVLVSTTSTLTRDLNYQLCKTLCKLSIHNLPRPDHQGDTARTTKTSITDLKQVLITLLRWSKHKHHFHRSNLILQALF